MRVLFMYVRGEKEGHDAVSFAMDLSSQALHRIAFVLQLWTYYSILQYTTVERTLVYVLVPIFSSFLKCLSSSSVCLNFPRPSVIPPTPNHPRRSHVVPFGEGALFGRAACTRLHTLPCTLPSSCNIKPSIQPGSSIPSVLQTNPCLPAKKKNP